VAILGNTFFDLIDLYRSQNPDGTIADVIEMQAESNPILEDAITVECNGGKTHKTTIRTGLPEGTWGELYQGIAQGKSTKQQVEDTTGFFEQLSGVDERLLELAKNPGAVRLSEATAHIESMNQTMANAMFYEDTATNPKAFKGLGARFKNTSGQTGKQIVSAAGSGSDNTSIWFVTWGENQCHLLYPEGTQAGISRKDMGRQRVDDTDGNPYFVQEELFRQHIGMSVRDWRFVSRIANIDTDANGIVDCDIYKFMRKAYYANRGRKVKAGKMAIYCNSDVMEALDAAGTGSVANSSGHTVDKLRLRPMEIEGKEVLTYRGIPIREVDALTNTEATVA